MVTNWRWRVVTHRRSCENVDFACGFKVLIIFAGGGNAEVGAK